METQLSIINKDVTERSYRTYEEWKHNVLNDILQYDISSYRTYEEWKLKKYMIIYKCL